MFTNVVINNLLVHPSELFAFDEKDWEENEKANTLFTTETFLPKIMVEAGVVKSTSEVKRNKPELFVNLDKIDFIQVKWGKKFLFIAVGE